MTAHFRMILVGVILPLLITLGGLIAVVIALPTLPLPIAVHWGPSGEPDGFGTPIAPLLLLALIPLAYSVFAFFVARSTDGSGHSTINQRMILAIGPFLATLLAVLVGGATAAQAGLADAKDAPSILPFVAVGFGGGILVGVLAWFLLPAFAAPVDPEPVDLPVLDLGETERATWMQRVGPSRTVGGILTVVVAAVVVGGGVGLWILAPLPAFVVFLVFVGLIALMAVSSLYWRVTIDAKGFVARSVTGLPRFVVPLDQVEAALPIDVRPVGDFGGWGLRWGGRRRMGIVTRTGEALEVRSRDGRTIVVTVSQAARGAALLNSLARRGRIEA